MYDLDWHENQIGERWRKKIASFIVTRAMEALADEYASVPQAVADRDRCSTTCQARPGYVSAERFDRPAFCNAGGTHRRLRHDANRQRAQS